MLGITTFGPISLDTSMIQLINRRARMTYDYAGNRVSQGSLNLANILLENSTHKFAPDEFGTGSLSQKVDRASGAAENFSYRADQKLTSYSRNGMLAEYYYDALGRRVAKKVTKDGNPAFTQSYVHLGEEDRILLGKSGDGEITVYLDGQGIDEHLGEVSSRGVKSYATDHLGSVLNGDAAGAAKAFGAWGENLNATSPEISASSSPVVYGYTGRQLDTESAAYHYRNRTYFPGIGRFAQPDPLGFAAGDTNLQRYVFNSPLNYVDPFGLFVGPGISPQLFSQFASTPQGQRAIRNNFAVGADQNYRYVQVGSQVIDMRHASAAYNQTNSLMGSGVPAALAGSITYLLGLGVEIDQTTGGRLATFSSTPNQPSIGQSGSSAFSPEDIVSNVFGIGAAKNGISLGQACGSGR